MSRIALEDSDLTRVKELAGASSLAPLAALSGLPVVERTAIEARVIDERHYADIALELECS
jgi:DNA-directed RNA polymerase specialized sigma24 family protein